jgi:hypothetical protein
VNCSALKRWVVAAADPAAVLAWALAALLLWKRVDWFAAFARVLSYRWSVLAEPAIAQARESWSERLTRRSAGA